jgi:hypothetical protein
MKLKDLMNEEKRLPSHASFRSKFFKAYKLAKPKGWRNDNIFSNRDIEGAAYINDSFASHPNSLVFVYDTKSEREAFPGHDPSRAKWLKSLKVYWGSYMFEDEPEYNTPEDKIKAGKELASIFKKVGFKVKWNGKDNFMLLGPS